MTMRPKCLIQESKQEQEYLRVSEIVKIYPIGTSTIWDWAKKGKLHPVKVSTRVTVFPAKELQELFMYGDKNFQNVKPQPTKKKRKKKVKTEVSTPARKKKTIFKKVQTKSYEELMEEYNSRKDKSCKPYSTMQSEKTVCFDDISLVKTETVQKPKQKKGYSAGITRRGLKIGSKGNNRPNDTRKIGGIGAKSNNKPIERRLIGGTERKSLIPQSSYQINNTRPNSESDNLPLHNQINGGKGYSGLINGEKALARLKKQRQGK